MNLNLNFKPIFKHFRQPLFDGNRMESLIYTSYRKKDNNVLLYNVSRQCIVSMDAPVSRRKVL